MGGPRLLVVGWYGHGNIGDEAFKTAFRKLWPNFDFTFHDHIPDNLQGYDGIWFGGGSFLDQKFPGVDKIPATMPVAFIGVGLGKFTHPAMQKLLNRARVVVLRDHAFSGRVKGAYVLADLAYGVGSEYQHVPKTKSKTILILMNDHITPRSGRPEWSWVAHQWFVQEFSQVCDGFIKEGYSLEFLPMCVSTGVDDRRAAAHVLGRLQSPEKARWILQAQSEGSLKQKIAIADVVLTQRLHGAVFSSIIKTPFVLIGHHDKMEGLVREIGWRGYIDYYGFKKNLFCDAYGRGVRQKPLFKYIQTTRAQWVTMSATVINRFFS